MKKEITLGQLLATAVTVIATIITAWITLSNKVATQGTRIDAIENWQAKAERTLDKIDDKLDKIIIKLENKKDR